MSVIILTKEDIRAAKWTFIKIRNEAAVHLFPTIELPADCYLSIKVNEEDGKIYAIPYSRESEWGPGIAERSEKWHKYFSEEEQRELRCEIIPATRRYDEEDAVEIEDEPNEITKEQAKEMFPWIEEIVTLRKLDHIYVSDDFADALESKGWDSGYDAGMMGSQWDTGNYTAIYEGGMHKKLEGKKSLSWVENSISDLNLDAPTVGEQIGQGCSHIVLWEYSGSDFDDTPTRRSITIYVSQKEVRE